MFGANDAPSFGRMDDAAAGRLEVCARRTGRRMCLPPSLDAVEQQRTLALTAEDTEDTRGTRFGASSTLYTGKGMKPTVILTDGHEPAEGTRNARFF